MKARLLLTSKAFTPRLLEVRIFFISILDWSSELMIKGRCKSTSGFLNLLGNNCNASRPNFPVEAESTRRGWQSCIWWLLQQRVVWEGGGKAETSSSIQESLQLCGCNVRHRNLESWGRRSVFQGLTSWFQGYFSQPLKNWEACRWPKHLGNHSTQIRNIGPSSSFYLQATGRNT